MAMAGDSQGKLLGKWIGERGKSERRAVIARIGVQALPRPERVPTSVWCGCRRFAFEIHQGESFRETGKATVQRPLTSVMRRINDVMLANGSCRWRDRRQRDASCCARAVCGETRTYGSSGALCPGGRGATHSRE